MGGGGGGNTTQTVVQQANLPQWYQDYVQNLIGNAVSQASGPAPVYGGAPVAPTAPTDPNAGANETQDQINQFQSSDAYTNYQKQLSQYNTANTAYTQNQNNIAQATNQWNSMSPQQQAAASVSGWQDASGKTWYGQPQGPGALNAGMSGMQNLAMSNILGMQNGATPYLNQANTYMNQATQNSPLAAAQNAFYSANQDAANAQGLGTLATNYGANATNIAGQAQQQADQFFGQGSGAAQSALNSAFGISTAQSPYLAQAQNLIGAGTGTDLLGTASPYINAAVGSSGLSAAQPWLQSASQSLPQATMQNMSPYTGAAMQSLANQANYQLQNQILPQLGGEFISAGQYGSTRQGDVTSQVINNEQQNLLNSEAQLLNTGYGQAQQAAGQNLALQGQLAQTAGGLGSAQQQALLGAGSTLGTLGGAQAGLQLQGAGQTAGLGSQAASALAQQAGLGFQGANAFNQLGLGAGNIGLGAANVNLGAGQTALGAGNLNLGAANMYNQQGATAGNLQNMQNQTLAQAGLNQMNLGQMGQNLGLQYQNALYNAGAQQQQLAQQNINSAYNQWLNQTFYPQNMTSWLSNIVRGLPSVGVGGTTTYQNATNPGAQVGGLLTAGLTMGTGGGNAQSPVSYGGGTYKRGGKVSFKNGGAANDNVVRGIGSLAA